MEIKLTLKLLLTDLIFYSSTAQNGENVKGLKHEVAGQCFQVWT